MVLVGCVGCGFGTVAFASGSYLSFGIGLGLSDIGKKQTYSPALGLVNEYDLQEKIKTIGPLLKVELGYVFDINPANAIAFGFEGAYLDYGTTTGAQQRGINLNSNLEPLSYSFDTQSCLLLAKTKLILRKNFWLPHIALGLGVSFNKLGNYAETTTTTKTAAPALHLYQDNAARSLAVLAEVGICRFKVEQHLNVDLSYRFIYSGNNSALKNPVSGEDSIGSGNLRAHLVVMSAQFHNII